VNTPKYLVQVLDRGDLQPPSAREYSAASLAADARPGLQRRAKADHDKIET
jgi:hypothetical protein